MLTEDQEGVAKLMSYISEDHYCAGWLHDLEFSLWDYVSGNCAPELDFGFRPPNKGLVKLLKAGAEMIGGWIVWDDSCDDDQWRRFVPMDEWQRVYDEHRQEQMQNRSTPLEQQGERGEWRSAT